MSNTFISFAGQTKAQTARLFDTRTQMLDLQRQMATQKKADTFSGLGSDAGTVQRLRTDSNNINSYMKNIDRASLRTTIMSEAMTEAVRVAREVVTSMRMQTREGDVEIGAIRTIAQENLRFLQDLVNSTVNGSYVFAGNDVRNPPLDNLTTLNTNIQNEMSNWLSGGQTPTQLTSNVDALSSTALGYSSSLQAAGDIYIKVDTSVEINYTVKANNQGFSDIIKGIATAANLLAPDPAVDIATEDEFFQIYDDIITQISSGIDALERDNFNLSSKASLMNSIQERQAQDMNTLQTILAKAENVDITETIIKLQSIESQLTASYEATRIVSRLSLINFI